MPGAFFMFRFNWQSFLHWRSSNDFSNWFAVIYFEAFAIGDFQTAAIEAHLPENGGMDICDIVPVFFGVEADWIGGAVD